ncbi:MAG TPA: MogA/MoaB family molybdenum cofactor biosynthesis protein [Methanoregulaceae archaeon]|nr:MogA/MoaB family molybdenum cofactor biosynthesis protein [Methanoregulaceae archaeon]
MKQEHLQPVIVTVGIITVSSSRTSETDTSGLTISEIMKKSGFSVTHYRIVPDRIDAIRAGLEQAKAHANCIIINGGTGLTHDDCTIEAVAPLLEKTIDGFGELFRMLSFQEIGTSALLSRAVAGTYRQCIVFCIPGSTPAVILATEKLIAPEIVHILSHATK